MSSWLKSSSAFLFALLSVLAISTVPSSQACSLDGSSGIAPKNDVKIPVNFVFAVAASMDEKTFDGIIARVENIYSPIISKLGARLTVEHRWTDPTANAYASRDPLDPNEWSVAMFGGLARHPDMTNDGFMLVMCHEVGHQIGGAPIYTQRRGGVKEWAANEGQADYFGALKCMRKVLDNDNNEAIVRQMTVPVEIIDRCSKSFKGRADRALCQRIAMAGVSLAKTLASLAREEDPSEPVPSSSIKDPDVVTKTFDAHPKAQCRMDTYLAATACKVSSSIDTSDTDPTIGTCAKEKKMSVGVRPACWYAAGTYSPKSRGEDEPLRLRDAGPMIIQ